MHAVLVLRGADVPAARVATRVRLVDIYPTVLELAAGIRGPAAGRSLAPLWLGSERADRDVFAYTIYPGAWQRAAMVGSWALRQDLLHGADYLYDLARDPQQRVNLIEREPQRAAQLERVLGDTWDRSMNNRVIEHHGRIYLRNLCALGQRNACLALQRATKGRASTASPAR
jgi:arylsulfatase A-like enzyme